MFHKRSLFPLVTHAISSMCCDLTLALGRAGGSARQPRSFCFGKRTQNHFHPGRLHKIGLTPTMEGQPNSPQAQTRSAHGFERQPVSRPAGDELLKAFMSRFCQLENRIGVRSASLFAGLAGAYVDNTLPTCGVRRSLPLMMGPEKNRRA